MQGVDKPCHNCSKLRMVSDWGQIHEGFFLILPQTIFKIYVYIFKLMYINYCCVHRCTWIILQIHSYSYIQMQNRNWIIRYICSNIRAIVSKMKIRNKFCTIFIMKYMTNIWENSVPLKILLAFQTLECSAVICRNNWSNLCSINSITRLMLASACSVPAKI